MSCWKFLVLHSSQFFIQLTYFRFGNFRENFIFANSIKRRISDVKNLQLRQDLPISIKDRSQGFYAKLLENKVLAKISEFTVLDSSHWHEFISTVESNVEPDLVLRSHLILIYTVFTTGYIWV